jgi:hypothetical protein
MTVSEVSQEMADGHVTLIGDFTDLEPGMVLTAPDGTETALFCTVDSDNTSADCNVGELGLMSGIYELGFGALCLADNEAGLTTLGSAVPGTLALQ